MKLIKTKKLLIILAFVCCFSAIANSARSETDNCPPAYRLPMVRQVRIDLARYLNKEITTENNPVLVNGVPGRISSGLTSFDSDYYNSPFVVIDIQPFAAGGRIVSVLFIKNPDKMFDFWIYQLANGNYEMRGVWLDPTYDSKEHFSLYEDYVKKSRQCAL